MGSNWGDCFNHCLQIKALAHVTGNIEWIGKRMERVDLGVITIIKKNKVLHHVYWLGQKSQGKKRSTQGLLSDYDGRSSLQNSKMHVSRSIGDVQFGSRLGSGSFGVVYAG